MNVQLEAAPDRGLKIRTVHPKSGRMATLSVSVYLLAVASPYLLSNSIRLTLLYS